MERWSDSLQSDGFSVLNGVLSQGQVERLRSRVLAIAAEERSLDSAWVSNGNQRVFSLLNKDPSFIELAEHPEAMGVIESVLGPYALLSSITAHVVLPGNSPQALHADQDYISGPWSHSLVVNVLWMLDEFTPDNGATVVLPGTHRLGVSPDKRISEGWRRVLAVGKAGSIVVLDGRVWHGSGQFMSDRGCRVAILSCYCAPFIRQQENHFRSLLPSVRESLSPRMRRLLGYEVWNGLGVVGGLPPAWANRADRSGLVNSDGAFPDGSV